MKLVKISAILSALILTTGSAFAACPAGFEIASFDEASANVQEACATLGTWDIARLKGGGSMDGRGYGCKIRNSDDRPLGNVLCKKTSVQNVKGNSCHSGSKLLDPVTALQSSKATCALLGEWDIAQLAGGGSMDGPGYQCGVRLSDTRHLGNALCTKYTFIEGYGDSL